MFMISRFDDENALEVESMSDIAQRIAKSHGKLLLAAAGAILGAAVISGMNHDTKKASRPGPVEAKSMPAPKAAL